MSCECLDWTNEEKLYHYLFDRANYSKYIRPVERYNEKVIVNLTLEMLQIVLLDEKEEYMKASVYFTHSWYDQYLHWEPEEFEDIAILRVPPKRAWNPDIVLLNKSVNFLISSCDLCSVTREMLQR